MSTLSTSSIESSTTHSSSPVETSNFPTNSTAELSTIIQTKLSSMVPSNATSPLTSSTSTTTTETSETAKIEKQKQEVPEYSAADLNYEYEDEIDDTVYSDDAGKKESRKRRSDRESEIWGKLVPGACMKGCAFGFYAFSIVSSIINCFGASGKIGNLLVNYRCVSNQDKSVTQGLILMLVSLFALIPGPILFGRIIDSTCLVWTEQCSGRRGNCQLYDQRRFRYLINLTAFALTGVGVFFDILVWKFGKNLDLYGEREEQMLKKREKDARNGRN